MITPYLRPSSLIWRTRTGFTRSHNGQSLHRSRDRRPKYLFHRRCFATDPTSNNDDASGDTDNKGLLAGQGNLLIQNGILPFARPTRRQRLKASNSEKRAQLVNLRTRLAHVPRNLIQRRHTLRRIQKSLDDPHEVHAHRNATGCRADVSAPVITSDQINIGQSTQSDDKLNDDAESPVKEKPIQLLDCDYFQRNMELPTQEQYPYAPEELFTIRRVSIAINNASQRLRNPMRTECDMSERRDVPSLLRNEYVGEVKVAYLKLEVPGFVYETAKGEGPSKSAAKRAAWLHVVAKLHAKGSLRQLFPESISEPRDLSGEAGNQEPSLQKVGDSSLLTSKSLPEASSSDLEEDKDDQASDDSNSRPVFLDHQIIDDERDAKLQIYNYAARMGLVPIFETETYIDGSSTSQLISWRERQPWTATQVTIKLPQLQIDATGVGQDPITAEIAAAIEFKRKAEQKCLSQIDPSPMAEMDRFSRLSTATAPLFFEFYQKIKPNTSLAFEYENTSAAGIIYNVAQLKINNTPAGESVVMRTKEDARLVSLLIAALQIAESEPEVAQRFFKLLKAYKGKMPRSVTPIELALSSGILETMRSAVVEARKAGLPDSKDLLSAEQSHKKMSPVPTEQHAWPTERFARMSESLRRKLQKLKDNPAMKNCRATSAELPVGRHRLEIIETVSDNLYSIVTGATGSGKTTQVPQILLENAIEHGEGGSCNIVCTQPRRIAAVSVARRVAAERDEPLQDSIGYHVRFDAKLPSPGGSITYCTTGILLEQLKHDTDGILDRISHLVIDEAHERDLNIDMVLLLIKTKFQERQKLGRTVPKVILMSASIDATLFANYFSSSDETGNTVPCPVLSVPGRGFHISEVYIEEIINTMIKEYPKEYNDVVQIDSEYRKYVKAELAYTRDQNLSSPSTRPIIDWDQTTQRYEDENESKTVAYTKNDEYVPISLVAVTIAYICSTSSGGSILAFLPGLQDIIRLRDYLLKSPIYGVDFTDLSNFIISVLHSSTPTEEQQNIYNKLPRGCRRIILSTNIAETSVTVPDVEYVVDTGKHNEKRYDPSARITRLQCTWESGSSARQRAGRAGRVKDGFYYALYSRDRRTDMRSSANPEIRRNDLQATCLSVMAQGFREPTTAILSKALEPPPAHAITVAMENLRAIEACTEDGSLTNLGRLLSKFPVHPQLGKMILMGAIFGCLDPMLILASLGTNSMFQKFSPEDAEYQAALAAHSVYTRDRSDHIAQVEAFKDLRRLHRARSTRFCRARARASHLHYADFIEAYRTSDKILKSMTDSKLIPETSKSRSKDFQYGGMFLNRNSGNTALVKALLLSGFHPNLAVKETVKGKLYRTATGPVIRMLSHSVNTRKENMGPTGSIYAFSWLLQGSKSDTVYMADNTLVDSLMVTLFGGTLRIEALSKLKVDKWLQFHITAQDAQYATKLTLEFRKALNRVLYGAFESLSNPRKEDPSARRMREQFIDKVVEVLNLHVQDQNLLASEQES